MNDRLRIGVFCSPGRDHVRTLQALRAEWPLAHLCAIVPSGYPVLPELTAVADEVLEMELAQYTLGNPVALGRLVRTLRKQRFNRFVVLFHSHRLRVLALLSGARERYWNRVSGQSVPLKDSVFSVLLSLIFCVVAGRMMYAYSWAVVHMLPVRTRDRSRQRTTT